MEDSEHMSHVSATIPWQEGTEEDFKDLHEGLARLRQSGGVTNNDDDDSYSDTSEEDDTDPGDGDPGLRLLWAAQYNKMDIVTELLTSDASLVRYKDSDGYTALHRAAYSHNTAVLSE